MLEIVRRIGLPRSAERESVPASFTVTDDEHAASPVVAWARDIHPEGFRLRRAPTTAL